MELSANELRIGNLITIDNSVYWLELRDIPLIVTHIGQTMNIKGESSHSVGCEHINPKTNTYYEIYPQFIENIKPIRLTEEWIINFGFEKTKHSHGYDCYIKDGFDFDIVSHGRYWVLAIYKDESCTDSLYFAHGRLEYVHQLQNLFFAFTGEELTI